MPGWKEIMVRYEVNDELVREAERERLAEQALSGDVKPGLLGAAVKSVMLLTTAIICFNLFIF
jgi:hypothetical protein